MVRRKITPLSTPFPAAIDLKREINYMAYDDLRRYAHEILVPLVTSLSGFGEDAEVVKRMVEYAYPDKARLGETSDLVLEIVKVGSEGLWGCLLFFL